ncbi:hypothetical protein lerEdw1_014178 [Lerista edwardsae]|nr:hypothetical protein lerEdw1_014179 [Lerista edwardsae]KAJ6634038.1 hypothetical protein lerEdw1_014178 [Lerista edwardsae]
MGSLTSAAGFTSTELTEFRIGRSPRSPLSLLLEKRVSPGVALASAPKDTRPMPCPSRPSGTPTLLLLTALLLVASTAPPTVRINHSGLACNIEEERYSERVYTIREGETLELMCLVTGHPRPQVSPLLWRDVKYAAHT